ncbi:MAG: hypothetical protein COB35_06520 [Gammaproteobacteria bacterium]|nr:MAG: hypothetical protein COB35_06520 [Gammaproteobacteria bacterium]
MNNWIAITFIVIAFVIIVGNFSTFQKNSKQRLRKKGLNDLKETIPRPQKREHKMATIPEKKRHIK